MECEKELERGWNSQYTDIKNIRPPASLQELIQELHKVFSEDNINVEYVHELMSSYKSKPKDWKQFAKFDPHRYTRNLVDDGNGKFNLIALCWGEGQGSSIHAHSNSHCFMKVLGGDLLETMYEWPEEGEEKEMVKREENTYEKDGVTYINDDLGLHRVENRSHADRAVSLHLYAPPFDMCHTFDQRSGHKQVCKVTFWSKFGKRTPFRVNDNGCATPCCKTPTPMSGEECMEVATPEDN